MRYEYHALRIVTAILIKFYERRTKASFYAFCRINRFARRISLMLSSKIEDFATESVSLLTVLLDIKSLRRRASAVPRGRHSCRKGIPDLRHEPARGSSAESNKLTSAVNRARSFLTRGPSRASLSSA